MCFAINWVVAESKLIDFARTFFLTCLSLKNYRISISALVTRRSKNKSNKSGKFKTKKQCIAKEFHKFVYMKLHLAFVPRLVTYQDMPKVWITSKRIVIGKWKIKLSLIAVWKFSQLFSSIIFCIFVTFVMVDSSVNFTSRAIAKSIISIFTSWVWELVGSRLLHFSSLSLEQVADLLPDNYTV